MKRLLLLLVPFSSALICRAAITAAPTDWGTAGVGPTTISSQGAKVGSGNLVAVFLTMDNSATIVGAPTDTAGNTYTQISAVSGGPLGAGATTYLFYAKNAIANASDVVSATANNGNFTFRMVVLQFSGVDTASPLDV